jgi:hypothetical protein
MSASFQTVQGRSFGSKEIPYLQALQLLQSLLDELLHLTSVLDLLMLPESVSRPPLRIFSEVVRRKVVALSQELSVL